VRDDTGLERRKPTVIEAMNEVSLSLFQSPNKLTRHMALPNGLYNVKHRKRFGQSWIDVTSDYIEASGMTCDGKAMDTASFTLVDKDSNAKCYTLSEGQSVDFRVALGTVKDEEPTDNEQSMDAEQSAEGSVVTTCFKSEATGRRNIEKLRAWPATMVEDD
jgi:hypothetical protein